MAQIQAAQRDKDPTGRESQTVVRVDNSPRTERCGGFALSSAVNLPRRELVQTIGEGEGQLQPILKSGLRWAFFTTEIVPHWAQSWLRPDNAPTVEYDGGPMGERL